MFDFGSPAPVAEEGYKAAMATLGAWKKKGSLHGTETSVSGNHGRTAMPTHDTEESAMVARVRSDAA
jgi:hypothetical protein